MTSIRFYDIEWPGDLDEDLNLDLPNEIVFDIPNNWFNPHDDGTNFIYNEIGTKPISFKWEIIDEVPDVGLVKVIE